MIDDALKIITLLIPAVEQVARWTALLAKAKRGESFTPEEHAALDAEIAAQDARIADKINALPEK